MDKEAVVEALEKIIEAEQGYAELGWEPIQQVEDAVRMARKALRIMNDNPKPKPWAAESLWAQCFFEVVVEARERGEDVVEFSDVDELVLGRSKVVSVRSVR